MSCDGTDFYCRSCLELRKRITPNYGPCPTCVREAHAAGRKAEREACEAIAERINRKFDEVGMDEEAAGATAVLDAIRKRTNRPGTSPGLNQGTPNA